MAKERFTKDLSVMGKNGLFMGNILVTMNYTTAVVNRTNPSSHEQYEKVIPLHKIEGYINNKLHWKQLDLDHENMVLNEIERCEKQLLDDMHKMANEEPIKSFADKIKDLGLHPIKVYDVTN